MVGCGCSVTVIDTLNGYATQVISNPQIIGPWAVAINPLGDRAYVTNGGFSSVSIINTVSHVVQTLYGPPGGFNYPTGIAAAPNGDIYVLNNGGGADGGVTVIDPAGNVRFFYDIPFGSYGIAVSPDGSEVYVANYAQNDASVTDPAGNTITTVPVTGGTSVAVDRSGHFFVNASTNNLVAFGHFGGTGGTGGNGGNGAPVGGTGGAGGSGGAGGDGGANGQAGQPGSSA